MQESNPKVCCHDHDYVGDIHEENQHPAHLVTTEMMVAETAAGTAFKPMALRSDGWHIASHAQTRIITAFAYQFAHCYRNSTRFSF